MTADSPGPADAAVRASHAERTAVADVLADALAQGKLTVTEYEERVSRAYAARTRGDLAPLTTDLVLPTAAPVPVPAGRVERLSATFGSDARHGVWTVPAEVSTRSVFGECQVDLAEADLTSPVTVIDAFVRFGSLTVVVPDDARVRVTGRAVFGSREVKRRGTDGAPDGPIIEVRCDVWFGSVDVRRPKRRLFG